MIQFILECIAFQLVFLLIYDLFLKRETFFQWNRLYLIGTYALSLILPWIKLEVFRTSIPTEYYIYPEFLWQLDHGVTLERTAEGSWFSSLPVEYLVFYGGMLLAACIFGYKLYRIQRLKVGGDVHHFPKFTRIVITNSELAFSFFRSIFLGDRILEKEHENIIQHELVHIEQHHSWDLLFFEMMRIVGWFNPLVYVYQNRVSELHEFIADAKVAKTQKKEQYQLLLSQVFQTENISFVNQFFKSSLIKKRIIMLQKTRSNKKWKLKYLFLIPVITAMLLYTSCEYEGEIESVETIAVSDIENLTEAEEIKVFNRLIDLSVGKSDWNLDIVDGNSTLHFSRPPKGSYISGPGNAKIKAKMTIESKILNENFDFFKGDGSGIMKVSINNSQVAFALVEEAPIFPGCEDATNPRECFNQKMITHVKKHFNYPKEAQELGVQGKVNLLFMIDQDGNISDIRKRGPHPLLEAEAERIIKRLPQMRPGKQGGKIVSVPFSIPITFKLQKHTHNEL